MAATFITNSSGKLFAVTIIGCLTVYASPGQTTEGGIGYYVPGNMATLMDLAPSRSGWVVEPMYLHYDGNFSATVDTPIAGLVAAGLSVNLDAFIGGALYTLEESVLGAKYTLGGYLSWVDVEVTGSISSALGQIRARSTSSGLGDTTLLPIMLSWQKGNWQYNAVLPVYTPTGEYEEGRLANPGLNYWAVDPTFAVAYSCQESGFNAALFSGITYNWENPDTDYQSGTLVHLDGSLQKMIQTGDGFITLGVEGFWLSQISDDENKRGIPRKFRQRSSGLGPVVGYVLPQGDKNLLFEFRWLPQLDTKNTTEGDYFWLKLVYQF